MAALTPGNERTITILPGLRTLLADLKPLHVGCGSRKLDHHEIATIIVIDLPV
jgi:hypothetical protein